jgi:SAM-dependent methyltransferase
MELFGTELHEAGLLWARKRVPSATLRRADARDLAAEPRYDAVGLFDVLEHIEDDGAVLDRIFAATRPGGGLLVSVPQHPLLWGRADEHAQHVRRYRAPALMERVTGAGFEIVRTTSFVTLLLPLMILSRLADRARPDRYDPWREFRVSRATNACLRKVLDIERLLIRCGVSLPVGGSLLVVARRPANNAMVELPR